MTIEHSKDGAAIIDTEYYWQPMETCPRSAKVQLLSKHGVAVYGEWHGKDTFWVGWAPLPKKRKEESNEQQTNLPAADCGAGGVLVCCPDGGVMNEDMKAAWLEITEMLGETTKEELDVFLRTWQRAVQAERNRLADKIAQMPFRDTAASFAVWIRNGGEG